MLNKELYIVMPPVYCKINWMLNKELYIVMPPVYCTVSVLM